MSWEDNTFPTADDPDDVGWMVVYWRTVKCDSGCKDGYRLESRQFQHYVNAATREEALADFTKFVENRKAGGKQDSIKNQTLFLCKVDTIAHISDATGAIYG